MHIYFDTEFTGLHKDTTLISIGLVSEDGRRFYAELTDYNRSQVNEWIQNNVINNLWCVTKKVSEIAEVDHFHIGNKNHIKEQLTIWFSQFDEVQLVSDVCHYDMVLLIDLFGTAFDLPQNVNPACIDINADIAKYYTGGNHKEAFDLNREKLVFRSCEIPGGKHNALHDAEIIRSIHRIMNDL